MGRTADAKRAWMCARAPCGMSVLGTYGRWAERACDGAQQAAHVCSATAVALGEAQRRSMHFVHKMRPGYGIPHDVDRTFEYVRGGQGACRV